MKDTLITTFIDYKATYDIRLENHLQQYADFDELHFLEKQIELYNSCYNTANIEHQIIDYQKIGKVKHYAFGYDFAPTKYKSGFNEDVQSMISLEDKTINDGFDLDLCEKLKQSFSKIITYLDELKNEITNPSKTIENSPTQIPTLNWIGSELELTELVKALIVTNKLNPELTQIEIFKRFRVFFNIEEFDIDQKISDFSTRKTIPKFLYKLAASVESWSNSKIRPD